MSTTLKTLRALADPTRLRILALIRNEELSVAELQDITRLAQSRISTHLGLLSETRLVSSRRDGKRTYYRFDPRGDESLRQFAHMAAEGARELAEYEADAVNLRRVLTQRQDLAQVYFNEIAGRFDRSYGPGRSWQAFGHVLLRLLPPLVVADLGSGEGLIAELLARNCKQVIAVDNSEKIIEFGVRKAAANGIKNLEFRLGDLDSPPVAPESVDVAILSQALHHAADPARAVAAAAAIVRPGGRVMLLDLARHRFEQARELYGDRWLGFTEAELHRWLEHAGLIRVEVDIVAREDQPPHFETLFAVGEKRR
jgi:ubiquinone/menaquinone biosynthesis C-methylase UbiE/DNA-binding transcriptional ArsR family regulator